MRKRRLSPAGLWSLLAASVAAGLLAPAARAQPVKPVPPPPASAAARGSGRGPGRPGLPVASGRILSRKSFRLLRITTCGDSLFTGGGVTRCTRNL